MTRRKIGAAVVRRQSNDSMGVPRNAKREWV